VIEHSQTATAPRLEGPTIEHERHEMKRNCDGWDFDWTRIGLYASRHSTWTFIPFKGLGERRFFMQELRVIQWVLVCCDTSNTLRYLDLLSIRTVPTVQDCGLDGVIGWKVLQSGCGLRNLQFKDAAQQ
jgi:hypothetical protein